MMRLAEIEAHIASMVELREIVGAMRSLASMRVQEAQNRVPGIRRYAATMAAGIGAALLLVPPPPPPGGGARGRRGLVLCTAEHGFVGGFNEPLLDAAKAALGEGDALFLLGTRGAVAIRERGWPAAWTHPMATRPEAAPETTRHLTAELYRNIAAGRLTRVEVMFARHRQTGGTRIVQHLLLPVDPAAFAAPPLRQAPLHNLPPHDLLEKLIADYVFALLTEAVVESLAAENAARFAAMQSAHDNVSKKLDQLRQDGRQARQTEITTELLDLVAGAEAQASGRSSS